MIHSSAPDYSVGRVVLDLRTLHPNTIYDCWLPLRMKSLSDDSRYGEVRLRYAVHWFSDQHRLLDYLKPPQACLRSNQHARRPISH